MGLDPCQRATHRLGKYRLHRPSRDGPRTADPSEGVVLVLNAGSSSIKFALYGAEKGAGRLIHAEIEGIGTCPRFHARDSKGAEVAPPQGIGGSLSVHELMHDLLEWIERHLGGRKIVAAGHRVVLGGLEHAAPVLIDGQPRLRFRRPGHCIRILDKHSHGAI